MVSPFAHPHSLEDCHSIADLRLLARGRLPKPVFDFVDGGAEDEKTLNRNLGAFDRTALIPRGLIDVSSVDLSTRFMGLGLAWPLICSPTGASRFCHPKGEMAVARAAAETETLYCLSTMATCGLEELAFSTTADKIFQLYVFKDKGVTRELIQRVKAAGYRALCITVDTAVPGKRERDLRSGWGIPIKNSLGLLASFLPHPAWLLGQYRVGRVSMPIVAGLAGSDDIARQSRYIGENLSSSVTWKDVAGLIDLWDGPFAIKGIMSSTDAELAASVGAAGIFVSNHGGRQLDGTASPLEVLPAIADAVGGRLDIALDGGVRRGSHILKALALGAKVCSVGRPYLYGLSCGGQAGVTKALSILKDEFLRAMKLSGCVSVASVDQTIVN